MKNLIRDYYNDYEENDYSSNSKQKFSKHKPNWK